MDKKVQFYGGVFNIESNENKVQEITENSNATQYPSAKAVNDALKRYLPLDAESEIVFDGGDASGEVDIHFVLDSVMSSKSNNPVKNKVIKDYIDSIAKTVLLAAHPIGSLYFSSEATEPSTLFGGTWERVKDKFILAAGDIYEAGTDGGESEVTLTEPQMPKHKHEGIQWIGKYNVSFNKGDADPEGYYVQWGRGILETFSNIDTVNAGGDQPHNNMPPYEVYYCWKRIA